MIKRCVVLLWILLLLAACGDDNKTALKFNNQTECGRATIALTNKDTGNIKEYHVDQGKTLEVELEPGVAYNYVVTYAGPGQAGLTCDTKEVETSLVAGETINVRLESVRDPALPTETPVSTETSE